MVIKVICVSLKSNYSEEPSMKQTVNDPYVYSYI